MMLKYSPTDGIYEKLQTQNAFLECVNAGQAFALSWQWRDFGGSIIGSLPKTSLGSYMGCPGLHTWSLIQTDQGAVAQRRVCVHQVCDLAHLSSGHRSRDHSETRIAIAAILQQASEHT